MKTSNKVVRVGIDLGKNRFHLWGVSESGQQGLKKILSRKQLLPFFANLEAMLIGVEACSGAHYWARQLTALGHDVRIMPPQYVKPYVQGNKNDFNDAEAICEALTRPNMSFVALKTESQQALLSVHTVRRAVMKQQTASANRIRGLLAEFGLVMGRNLARLKRELPGMLEDAENGLPMLVRTLLADEYEALQTLGHRVKTLERQIHTLSLEDEAVKRLQAIEGVGELGASAMVATFGHAEQFDSSRGLAAALGLVPKHSGTGGQVHMLGISKRGNRYLRTILIHGARSALEAMKKRTTPTARSQWALRLIEERGYNKAAVALAHKNARIIWALLTRGEQYRVA